MIVAGIGLPVGAFIGVIDAWMLVRLLSRVLDPSPDHLNVPWLFLGFTCAGMIASTKGWDGSGVMQLNVIENRNCKGRSVSRHRNEYCS